MRGFVFASTAYSLVCPRCERGELHAATRESFRCTFCKRYMAGEMLETLKEIATLPDAFGSHACECGHPEMRCLPGGVYWCPACGMEVEPFKGPDDRSGACRCC